MQKPISNAPEEQKETIMLGCASCPNKFPFTQGEQAFYAARGLFPPKRCPVCRLKRKNKQG